MATGVTISRKLARPAMPALPPSGAPHPPPDTSGVGVGEGWGTAGVLVGLGVGVGGTGVLVGVGGTGVAVGVAVGGSGVLVGVGVAVGGTGVLVGVGGTGVLVGDGTGTLKKTRSSVRDSPGAKTCGAGGGADLTPLRKNSTGWPTRDSSSGSSTRLKYRWPSIMAGADS